MSIIVRDLSTSAHTLVLYISIYVVTRVYETCQRPLTSAYAVGSRGAELLDTNILDCSVYGTTVSE